MNVAAGLYVCLGRLQPCMAGQDLHIAQRELLADLARKIGNEGTPPGMARMEWEPRILVKAGKVVRQGRDTLTARETPLFRECNAGTTGMLQKEHPDGLSDLCVHRNFAALAAFPDVGPDGNFARNRTVLVDEIEDRETCDFCHAKTAVDGQPEFEQISCRNLRMADDEPFNLTDLLAREDRSLLPGGIPNSAGTISLIHHGKMPLLVLTKRVRFQNDDLLLLLSMPLSIQRRDHSIKYQNTFMLAAEKN